MLESYKGPGKNFLKRFKILIGSSSGFVILFLIFFSEFSLFFPEKLSNVQAGSFDINQNEPEIIPKVGIIQENTVLPSLTPTFEKKNSIKNIQKIYVVLTGYSSSPYETDDTPFITASGSIVRNEVVANNFLPFGTKIKIPEIFGDKIFVVEDRMHYSKGNYHIDIWFENQKEAIDFGVKRTYIEIVNE